MLSIPFSGFVMNAWNILVIADFHHASDQAAKYALDLARDVGANVHVVRGEPSTGSTEDRTEHEAQLRRWKEQYGLYVQIIPVSISTKSGLEVVQYAREHDAELIVVGLSPAGLRDFFLGPEAVQAILDAAHCPVTVIRSTGDASTASPDKAAGKL